MPYIVFEPRTDAKDASGWPVEVIGDGFIRLYFWQETEGGTAIYRDQFKEEHELEDKDAAEWYVWVRED